MKNLAGKFLYGVLFCIAVPFILGLWAWRLDQLHELPALERVWEGTAVAMAGVLMMAWGMLALWRRGGGLPMNAFPPPRFVSTGIYSLVPHPIYYGFTALCAGVALVTGSAAGLWIVTPFAAACCSALVLGHELPDLLDRFGPKPESLWLPRPGGQPPLPRERQRLYFTVLIPWLGIYLAMQHLGPFLGVLGDTYLPMEAGWPVNLTWEPVYASIYALVIAAPFLLQTGNALRTFAALSLRAMAIVFPLYFLIPFFVPPRAVPPEAASSLFFSLHLLERSPVSGGAAFPSFHVLWALIVAEAFADGRTKSRFLTYLYAAAVAASSVFTGMHAILDVMAAIAVFPFMLILPSIWRGLLHLSEKVANSWREWRFGGVRVINHGGWAALATLIIMLEVAAVVGESSALLLASVYVSSTVGAALWAQWVEGSPSLLRPLGFYGGMVGAGVGALVAFPLGLDIWVVLAAICLGSPWMQAVGRLRCLVQGCCHGAATRGAAGIHYYHPRSRVCRLTKLGGREVYATPLFSVLCCAATGLILLRLYLLDADAPTLCAAYLILSGLGRFVEEGYRGEPQTLVTKGLRLYQWIAVATVATGMGISCLRGTPMPEAVCPSVLATVIAVLCAAAAWFVTGMDFPESNRRFARLT